jgi:hypothetical protein
MKKIGFLILILLNINFGFSQSNQTIKVVKEEKDYKFDTTITYIHYTLKSDLQGAYIVYGHKPLKSNSNNMKVVKGISNVYIRFDTMYFVDNQKVMKRLVKKKRRNKNVKKLNLNNYHKEKFDAYTKTIETSKYYYTVSKSNQILDSIVSDYIIQEFIIINQDTVWAGNSFKNKYLQQINDYSLVISDISSINGFNYHNKNFKSQKKVTISDTSYHEHLLFELKNLRLNLIYFKAKSNSSDLIIQDFEVYVLRKTSQTNIYEILSNNNSVAKLRLMNGKIILFDKSNSCSIDNTHFKINRQEIKI